MILGQKQFDCESGAVALSYVLRNVSFIHVCIFLGSLKFYYEGCPVREYQTPESVGSIFSARYAKHVNNILHKVGMVDDSDNPPTLDVFVEQVLLNFTYFKPAEYFFAQR
jgi:hypothetical protein